MLGEPYHRLGEGLHPPLGITNFPSWTRIWSSGPDGIAPVSNKRDHERFMAWGRKRRGLSPIRDNRITRVAYAFSLGYAPALGSSSATTFPSWLDCCGPVTRGRTSQLVGRGSALSDHLAPTLRCRVQPSRRTHRVVRRSLRPAACRRRQFCPGVPGRKGWATSATLVSRLSGGTISSALHARDGRRTLYRRHVRGRAGGRRL